MMHMSSIQHEIPTGNLTVPATAAHNVALPECGQFVSTSPQGANLLPALVAGGGGSRAVGCPDSQKS